MAAGRLLAEYASPCLECEAQLQAEVDRLQALLRLREQQLFGRKTEAGAATEPTVPPANPDAPPPRRNRGQQRGRTGPKRRDYSHLPAVVEDQHSPRSSAVVRVVASPLRTSRAPRMRSSSRSMSGAIAGSSAAAANRPTCSCAAHPGIVVAPPPSRLIPKSLLGVSIWVDLLLDKYLFYRPTLSTPGRLGHARPGPVLGHGH